ncbi:cytochrome P450 [Heliocybe sulcata]|uniref:Cytochrome P450 n=1 Tax=Heliocybe sulcata TaxID=5364 RepID=A0A5C3NA19_9AGAM|nr:cytochrome P450 [Heliocybe sulcata]
MAAAALPITAILYKIFRRTPLASIAGPPSQSWLLGNVLELAQGAAGEVPYAWKQRYGSVIKYKGPFGEDRLMVSDPKALQHIFNTSSHDFCKPKESLVFLYELSGPNIVAVEGEAHRRQRKIILPAFGPSEIRALFPVFQEVGQQLVSKWQNMIGDQKSIEINVNNWLSRAALDAVGQAGFNYTFGAIDDAQTELGKAYNNLAVDTASTQAYGKALLDAIISNLPPVIMASMFRYFPAQWLSRIREAKRTAYKVAKQLVVKAQEVEAGTSRHDIMSLLVKANASEESKSRLSDEELYAQMSVMLLAGHETTATSLSWALWVLAGHKDVQHRMRQEILAAEDDARSQGEASLSLTQVEKLPYFQAVLKESMRLHPAIFQNFRVAARDVVVSLSKPVMSASGVPVNEVAIPAGTRIVTSYSCYNRDKDIWGDDANEFKPERWLSESETPAQGLSLGVVGHLMNFGTGGRTCVGWRFAMAEMQCFLLELVKNFEFDIDPKKEIVKIGDIVAIPVVVGEEEKGAQLPLYVSLVPRR